MITSKKLLEALLAAQIAEGPQNAGKRWLARLEGMFDLQRVVAELESALDPEFREVDEAPKTVGTKEYRLRQAIFASQDDANRGYDPATETPVHLDGCFELSRAVLLLERAGVRFDVAPRYPDKGETVDAKAKQVVEAIRAPQGFFYEPEIAFTLSEDSAVYMVAALMRPKENEHPEPTVAGVALAFGFRGGNLAGWLYERLAAASAHNVDLATKITSIAFRNGWSLSDGVDVAGFFEGKLNELADCKNQHANWQSARGSLEGDRQSLFELLEALRECGLPADRHAATWLRDKLEEREQLFNEKARDEWRMNTDGLRAQRDSLRAELTQWRDSHGELSSLKDDKKFLHELLDVLREESDWPKGLHAVSWLRRLLSERPSKEAFKATERGRLDAIGELRVVRQRLENVGEANMRLSDERDTLLRERDEARARLTLPEAVKALEKSGLNQADVMASLCVERDRALRERDEARERLDDLQRAFGSTEFAERERLMRERDNAIFGRDSAYEGKKRAEGERDAAQAFISSIFKIAIAAGWQAPDADLANERCASFLKRKLEEGDEKRWRAEGRAVMIEATKVLDEALTATFGRPPKPEVWLDT